MILLFLQEKPEKKTRIRAITDGQRQEIESMTSSADMPYEERKRQYAALRRAIHADANPALICKFKMANDAERPDFKHTILFWGVPSCNIPINILPFLPLRWGMLKAWMLNPDLAVMDVEEKFRRYSSEQRTDRYATAPYTHSSYSYYRLLCCEVLFPLFS